MIPVSALSAWTHCPRQFFLSYVLKIKTPSNSAMVLGLMKHKLLERASILDASVFPFLKKENFSDTIKQEYAPLARSSVVTYARSLRATNVTLTFAHAEAKKILDRLIAEKISTAKTLIAQGFSGEELWHSLQPKIKPEYSIESKRLGLKGRIDRLECFPDTLMPVELKSGKAPQEGVFASHRIQAAAYAMLLEEKFQTDVPRAIVYYVDSGERRAVTLNPFSREEINELASAVTDVLASKELPKGCGREGCTACHQCNNAEFISGQLQKLDAVKRKV